MFTPLLPLPPNFSQDMTSQLRESQKEADRDLWEQQNTEKQNTMTVAALFLAGAFAMAVEGQLPADTRDLLLIPFIPLVEAYYFMLALCISMVRVATRRVMPGLWAFVDECILTVASFCARLTALRFNHSWHDYSAAHVTFHAKPDRKAAGDTKGIEAHGVSAAPRAEAYRRTE